MAYNRSRSSAEVPSSSSAPSPSTSSSSLRAYPTYNEDDHQLDEEGGRAKNKNVSYNRGPASSSSSSSSFPPSSPSPSAPSSSSQAAANRTSLSHYSAFMFGLVVLSVFLIFVAVSVLGSRSLSIVLVLIICILSFLFTLLLTRWIIGNPEGDASMRVISDAIQVGSEGFLRVQYTAITVIAVVVAVGLGVIYMFRATTHATENIPSIALATMTAVSFIVGAFCSGLAGYIGVWISVRVNIRVAAAAARFNYADSLLLAFRGGAVSAALSASLCILGVTALYLFSYVLFSSLLGLSPSQVPVLLVGYGFGASFVALFMQLGGGIYTKGADVGADMCGKIEASIPEDDPRNPAVIADLVGDNVGDCAGSMADVFESIAAEVIGTMILGSTLADDAKLENHESFIFFPLVVHALDLVISGAAIYMTRSQSDKEDPLETMKRSYRYAMLFAVVGFFFTCRVLLVTERAPDAWWFFFLCGLVGIVTSYLLIHITQYYTDYNYAPVKRIAFASQTGHGTNVIAGISVGLESTGLPICVISAALLSAYTLGSNSGLPAKSAGVYGTAVATMGMLCTAVFVLSMNNFGPIADNAGGIVEMSGQPESVRVITDRLDAVGNVTKAASKGYAVGGSALACFVLFQAFLDEVSDFTVVPFDVVNIAKVEVVCGALLGIMMIFVFSGWAMQAVGTTAQKVVWEVRRQFKEKPGIMDGSEAPDYDVCVAIVTRAALAEMVAPALLALILPVSVGFGFRLLGEYTNRPMLGLEVVAAFMLFGTLTGLLMAILMDNAGGAWDNAKKLIESQGSKGTDAHKAAVTGDTVGDPFKDTAGPALHVIINTMSTCVLVLAPMFLGSEARRS